MTSTWIGLKDDDIGSSEGSYYWTDGTALNYIASTNSLADNIENRDCVDMDIPTGEWAPSSCTGFKGTVCNAPSELCFDDQWSATGSWSNVTANRCDVYNEWDSTPSPASYRIEQFWDREWGTVSAEYIWKMDTVSNYSASSVQSGIVFQLKDAEDASADDISLFAGIQIMNDVIRFSVRDRYSGTYTLSDELFNGSTINLTDYQILRVELDDNGNITTSLNGEELLSTVDVSASDRVLAVSTRCV